MTINETKFNEVVEAAKAKAGDDKKWQNAIDRAAKEILDGSMIVTVLAHGALVTTANGTYASNGTCSCKAARNGHTQCAHRAGARLMDRYESEVAAEATFTADVAESPRANLIVEIKNIWSRVEPTVELADATMARFGTNRLESLPTETLKDIRLALAA